MNILDRSADSPPLWPMLGVLAGLGAAAVLAGLLAASANPLLIAVGIGALLGGLLLLAPKANLWLAIVLGLSTGAVLSFAGTASTKLQWGVVLLTAMLFMPVVLHALPRPRLPLFLWLYLAFIALSLLSSLVHWDGASAFISSMKRYNQALGIMLALAVLPLDWHDHRRLRTTFFWIALLQLPFVLYEAFVLVPIRIAIAGADATSQVTDVIAGTFGANLKGGSPGAEMVAFVLMLIGFGWARWRMGTLSTARLGLFVVAMLPCIGLGEVKYVVILFPLMALVLYWDDIVARPGRYLPVMAAALLVNMAFVYLYFGYFSGATVDKGFAEALRYNVADQGYGRLVLNRTTVLSFWWKHQGLHDPVGFLIGNGAGSAYWTTDPNVASGSVGARFPWYGVGLTGASMLLWDMGLLGTLLYVAVFVVAFVQARRLYRRETDAQVRAVLLGLQAALAVILAFIPYSNSMLNVLPFQIVVAVVLGYLARVLADPQALRTAPAAARKAA
jgi:hypothetical protein